MHMMTRNSDAIISDCELVPSPENFQRIRHLVSALTGEVQRFKRENGQAYKFIASTGMKVKRPMLLSALYSMWQQLHPGAEVPALPARNRKGRKLNPTPQP